MIGGDDDDGSVFGSYVSNIGLERLGNVVCPMDSIRVLKCAHGRKYLKTSVVLYMTKQKRFWTTVVDFCWMLIYGVKFRWEVPPSFSHPSHQQKMFFLAAFLTLWLYCSEVQWGAFKNFNGIPPIQQLIDSLIQVAWNVLFLWDILDLFYFQTAIDAGSVCQFILWSVNISFFFFLKSKFRKIEMNYEHVIEFNAGWW